MKRSLVRTALAATGIAVALAATSLTPAGAQSAPDTTTTTKPAGSTGAPVTPSGDPAIDDLVGCVQGSRELLVLFLIDESASLKQTDPDNRRVDAARGALDSLIALSSSEGAASPNVDVSLAAFSNEFRTVQDWTEAGPDSADQLNESLDEFAEFNGGKDTDFVNALSAGREALADQAAVVTSGGGDAPCRAIMLFTDGGYDLGVRASEADQEEFGTTKPYAPGIELTTEAQVKKAEALGRRALCDPGELADEIRGDDITLLTVALSGDVARRAQLPLAAATAGKADDYTCGTQPKEGESSRPQGAYLPAEDIDVLITQFNGVGTRLAGGNLVPGKDQVEICGADPCAAGTRTFTLDRSLRRAQVIALPPAEGATVVLEAPDGSTAEVSEAGTSKVGSTELVTRSVAGRGFAIDLVRPDDDASWTGGWKASITDPEQEGEDATLQVYVFSDIGVAFAETPSLERGATADLEVKLELPKGVKSADVIDTAEASVRLRNPVTGRTDEIPLEGKPGGPFTGTYDVPETLTSNVVEATAEVRISTTSDAVLVSQSAPTEVLVRRPEGSIQFAPGAIQMPSLTGEGSSEGEMILVGGEGAGCVWFGTTDVPEPPEGAGPVAVTLADGSPLPGKADCIQVPKGESVTLTIEAKPDGRASGTVAGTLEVFEKVDGGPKETTTQVPFRFDMARGVDQAQRLLLSLVLLLGGLALPLGALLLLNAVSARFQDLDAVQGTALPVRVVGTAISRVDGAYARPLSLRSDDFGSLAAAGNNRRFTFGGVEFRARASRNPFGATIAMAAPEGGAAKLKGNVGSRVELDPALAGSWIFLLDSDKTRLAGKGEVVGLLIAFVAEGNVATQTDRMLPDIERRLPEIASRLAGLVRSVRVKAKKGKGAEAAAEADAGAGAVAADPAPVATAPPTPEPEPAPEPQPEADPVPEAEPEAPAPPVGFGGVAPGGVPTGTPTPDGPDDDDDGPSGPPVGFTGVRPD
ncbi:MAG TPA: VWA domain-containing protein [Acidimicrobiales bacterium]|nr:VWA domain-containing protein [Acidimicrobiales bacterium]